VEGYAPLQSSAVQANPAQHPHTPVTAAVAVAVANADGAMVLSTSCCTARPGTASGLIDSLPPSLLLPLLPAAAPPLLLGLLLLLSGMVRAAGHEAIGLRPPPEAAAAAAARAAASCFAFLRLAAETAAHQLAASKASKPCSWTFSEPVRVGGGGWWLSEGGA
jgi:hypothetical protein